ncbi:hypothetical protein WSM22_14210 [Cytophagales bacterium WSM2-2]|nr:hypothetical protein WSM22_14210 [Cytophagales bacterium WSM2-2]
MEEFRLIEFHHARDFGKKINATFEFIKQNFKPLAKSILLIAGPAVLIGSILLGSFFSDLFSMFPKMGSGNAEALEFFKSTSYWSQLGLMYLFLFLSYVVTLATINSYIQVYYKKKSNQIEVSEVWEGVRSLIWSYLGSLLMIIFCAALFMFVIVLVGIVLGKISTALLVIAMMAAGVGFIYLLVGIALVFFIQAHEGTGFFESAVRSLRLISGKWWSTFGLSFILSMIGGVISYIFIIPYYIFIAVTAMHSVSGGGDVEMGSSLKTASYLFFTLYYMAQMLLQTLPQVGLVFQYFNLVELKESKGLMGDIENFGKPNDTDQRNETF